MEVALECEFMKMLSDENIVKQHDKNRKGK